MSGLTMGLLSLDIMSLEVLKRGGKPHQQVQYSIVDSLHNSYNTRTRTTTLEVCKADSAVSQKAPSSASDSATSQCCCCGGHAYLSLKDHLRSSGCHCLCYSSACVWRVSHHIKPLPSLISSSLGLCLRPSAQGLVWPLATTLLLWCGFCCFSSSPFHSPLLSCSTRYWAKGTTHFSEEQV